MCFCISSQSLTITAICCGFVVQQAVQQIEVTEFEPQSAALGSVVYYTKMLTMRDLISTGSPSQKLLDKVVELMHRSTQKGVPSRQE